MKKQIALKFKRYYILIIFVLVLFLYLALSYSYFYYKQDCKIPWPNNQLVYNFNESATSKIKYVSLGDSLTYGFGADNYEDSYTYNLANYLAIGGDNITLNDLSYPGFKTDDVIKQLNAVKIINPDIVTLFIGVNDVHQVFETSNFKENYEHILYRLTNETGAKIYVINIPYLGPASVLLPPYNYFYDAKTRSHNKTIKKLALKYQVNYIDLYGQTVGLFKKTGPHYSKDLYHPSAEGYKIWSGIIQNDIHL